MFGWLKRLFWDAPVRGYQPKRMIIGAHPPLPPIRSERPSTASMFTERSSTPSTDWDVAEQAFGLDSITEPRAPDLGRVEYRFLGMTGEEDA